MLIAYLSTLLFIYMMSITYGIYKLAFRLIDGRSFFVPNKEKVKEQSIIDDLRTSEQMPDNLDGESEELYGMPEEHISPELVEKNRLHDEKIERLKSELDAFQGAQTNPYASHILDENSQRVGVVFDEDHAEVDVRYIPKPTHEYTD